jgi:hypothetical protein
MSYSRYPEPYYIYPSGGGIIFVDSDNVFISDGEINYLLYELLLKYRRNELIERLTRGRELHLKLTKSNNFLYEKLQKGEKLTDDDIINSFNDMPEDDPEMIAHKQWLESQEDELIKSLLNNEI